jgi:hypothetical protein
MAFLRMYFALCLTVILYPLINGNFPQTMSYHSRTASKSYTTQRWGSSTSSNFLLPNILTGSKMRHSSRLAVADDQANDDSSDDGVNDDDQGNDDSDDSNSDDDSTSDDDQADDDSSQSDDGLTDDSATDDSPSDDKVIPKDDSPQGDDGTDTEIGNESKNNGGKESKPKDDNVDRIPQTMPPLSWPIFNPTAAPLSPQNTSPTKKPTKSSIQSCVNSTDGTRIISSSCPPSNTSQAASLVSRGATTGPSVSTAAVVGPTVAAIIILGIIITFFIMRRQRQNQRPRQGLHQKMDHQSISDDDDNEALFDGSPMEAYSRGYREGYEYRYPTIENHDLMHNHHVDCLPNRVKLEKEARRLGFLNKSSIASYCDGFRDGHDAANEESDA